MEHFRKTHRVIYMDYRGHGQSDRPSDASSMTIESFGRDILELFNELEIESAPLLGHSLGVNILLDFYRLAPKRVSALVLANGSPKDPFETMFHHNFMQLAMPWIQKAHSLFPSHMQKFWAGQGTNPINQFFVTYAGFNPKLAKKEDIHEYLRLTSTVDLDLFLHLLNDFMKYDATPWLHEIEAPTLVIAGERDLVTPLINQRIFAELIPYSELCIVPESGHCPQMEKREMVNLTIDRFLESVKAEAKPEAKPRSGKSKAKPKAKARPKNSQVSA